MYGPPGTGKTLCARAVANRTDACFIRVIGSELVQKYVGEGARMVRELFEMARTKKACIIFFDAIDAVGGARFDDGSGGDNEVQRTMLELINQVMFILLSNRLRDRFYIRLNPCELSDQLFVSLNVAKNG